MTAEGVGDGLLVVDKPAGWTSHDVVARARRLCGTRRVGHAGTLDPMATGVLVLGVNRGTKLLTFLVGHDKGYAATVRLGRSTVTDDAEGETTGGADAGDLDDARVLEAVAGLTGAVQQVPSAVSAVKVDGRRSYARVRSGEEVELAARPVTVHRFEVLGRRDVVLEDGHRVVDLDVEVEVSSGTYVRALARDLGAALGVGGHLTALRRTRVGGYTLDRAVTLDQLDPDTGDGPSAHLLDLAAAARAALEVRQLDEAEARALGYGQRVPSAVPGRTAPVAAVGPDGTLVAVLDESGPTARAHVVLAPAGQK
ncbi:tRNA pseudouridine(55) synthase TruB [Ornithinimicrobium sp. CNJ-824]|uniref:tRNA pseudouridine(55) synthase TruB n=1 Tax=Ornithinimicrobium sp. CNJ-824 TaxID=1904966 RepID=UPI000963DE25|nr:tRNA pseudouridine(55) synthase TruB [Ornithinimicrobium sp. CNJ-824]OLT20957.1 tRNA pseudouridine(55) synthase TruB [Ornithinimicrobium sp. CNJ-824]